MLDLLTERSVSFLCWFVINLTDDAVKQITLGS